jgi:hypothetical protein
MGNYNPHAPYVLGEEWVPIRDEDVLFSPTVNSQELGHRFTLATATQVRNARYYVNRPPDDIDTNRSIGISIYPAGAANQSGPLREVIIPVASAVISGTSSFAGATTAQEALLSPSDNKFITWSPVNAASSGMMVSFAVGPYLPELVSKRIVDLAIVYTAASADTGEEVPMRPAIQQGIPAIASASQTFDLIGFQNVNDPFVDQRFDFGNGNRVFTPGSLSREMLPWRVADIARFAAGATNPLAVRLITAAYGTASDFYSFYYLALHIVYCDEQRLYVAGAREDFNGVTGIDSFVVQTNTIPLRSLPSLDPDPVLPAGDYDITVHSIDPGEQQFRVASYPELNGLRELYSIPPHPGLQVDIPFPPLDHLGETFTEVVSAVLPQLSLHTTGGTVVTEPHVYGRQGAAQVWGSNTATQEIYDDLLTGDASYPQVRFYARRFGDTTVPLTLTGTASLAASTVSIGVSDFDLLTEIVDGWKEITLRFATPPTMGSLVSPEPSWEWSASGEAAGNRWEVLAACAPAISGIPGNLLNLAATGQLGPATYQPPAGDTVELTWMPQGVASPWVSGASADQGCDAVLIFSQDPPTITGVTLTPLTQTVTGIGLDCGSTPCCIPTGIAYQRITWSATSLPATGFGGYELQRWDTTPGADFETIMLASSPDVTGAWSSYVTGAPPEPGVTGADDCDQTGALIFTSNAAQSGAHNAAYVMQWEREPSEDFKLPEADMVTFQPMYQRDGMVAFHGTERGLEQFTRTLLIQAAAIDPIRLADVKTLRDLAWADLPYVCVRDEAGDRWFANVRVPTVKVRNNRTRYFADILITELTTCPYPVDPS